MKPLMTATILILGGLAVAADPSPVVTGNNQFGRELFAQLTPKPGNVFFSPFSVSTALAMTATGARGATYEEMAKVLHLPTGNAAAGFAALLPKLQSDPNSGFELRVANAIWGQQGFPFKPEFTAGISGNFGGALKPVNFADTATAARTINAWVEEQTNNRIKDLIDPTMIDSQTRLALTNAIYFLGKWESAFDKTLTADQPFFTSAGKSVTAALMQQSGHFAYGETNDAQVVELPYKGKRLVMTVILPKSIDGLAAVEEKLLAGQLDATLAALVNSKGHVALPRFEFKTKYRLERDLIRMGMAKAFSDAADFSGMTDAERLGISFVIHKAFVKVDEQGTEAAAATGVGIRAMAALPEKTFQFRADRPFVFMIRDRETGSMLFAGRLSDPTAAGEK